MYQVPQASSGVGNQMWWGHLAPGMCQTQGFPTDATLQYQPAMYPAHAYQGYVVPNLNVTQPSHSATYEQKPLLTSDDVFSMIPTDGASVDVKPTITKSPTVDVTSVTNKIVESTTAMYAKNANIKPPYSYAALICMAINNAPNRLATMREILAYIEQNYAYYRSNKKWHGTIRHDLTVNDCFMKMPPRPKQKGCLWTINDEFKDMFDNGSLRRRRYRFKEGTANWVKARKESAKGRRRALAKSEGGNATKQRPQQKQTQQPQSQPIPQQHQQQSDLWNQNIQYDPVSPVAPYNQAILEQMCLNIQPLQQHAQIPSPVAANNCYQSTNQNTTSPKPPHTVPAYELSNMASCYEFVQPVVTPVYSQSPSPPAQCHSLTTLNSDVTSFIYDNAIPVASPSGSPFSLSSGYSSAANSPLDPSEQFIMDNLFAESDVTRQAANQYVTL